MLLGEIWMVQEISETGENVRSEKKPVNLGLEPLVCQSRDCEAKHGGQGRENLAKDLGN